LANFQNRHHKDRVMTFPKFLKICLILALLGVTVFGGYLWRDSWLPWISPKETFTSAPPNQLPEKPTTKVFVSDQAQKNLGLIAKPLQAGTFWKTISIPGMVVDRPGLSDRGIIAPVTGVVTSINRVPGDTVRPGESLFTLKLLSESLYLTQSDLFKTSEEVKIAEEKFSRVKKLAAIGTESQMTLIEVESQLKRLGVAIKAYRQDLYNRGLSTQQIEGIAQGTFVSEISVGAPTKVLSERIEPNLLPNPVSATVFELQELKVELGQQVQAGQTLCLLANHQNLSIEGRAFRDETDLLERSVQEGWPVEVDFQEGDAGVWGPAPQEFLIRHIANNIDPVNRTFAFLLPLSNQVKVVDREGRIQFLWRYRPGQKVLLRIRVNEMKNVFVLPADAVVREGPEAFAFTQNANTFEKVEVRVLVQDRTCVVIANNGSLATFSKPDPMSSPQAKEQWTIAAVAQSGASQLNRMAKSGTSPVPAGFHIHADGSLHKNDDEK